MAIFLAGMRAHAYARMTGLRRYRYSDCARLMSGSKGKPSDMVRRAPSTTLASGAFFLSLKACLMYQGCASSRSALGKVHRADEMPASMHDGKTCFQCIA